MKKKLTKAMLDNDSDKDDYTGNLLEEHDSKFSN